MGSCTVAHTNCLERIGIYDTLAACSLLRSRTVEQFEVYVIKFEL